MTLAPVLAAVAAYALIGMLLLSLNLTSRWIWWIKAGAIVTTTAFFGVSYLAITSFFGWPSRDTLPSRFQLVWSKVVEPDAHSRNPGAIYLWLEELDENNLPSGVPRAYQLRFDPNLARRVNDAQERRQRGEEVAGKAETIDQNDELAELGAMHPPPESGLNVGGVDTVPFADDGLQVQFEDMPPPILPDKPPL
jgi:hypothetical protein